MSETQNKNDEILDRNVGELLSKGHNPPRIDEAASARILAALEKKLESAEQAPEAKTEPRKGGFFASLFATPVRAGALAAALAGVVVVSGYMLNRDRGESQSAAAFEPTDYENTAARPKRIQLADGSVLTLRAGASLRATSRRSLELRAGDVLLDVAKDSEPFVITRPSSDQQITVLGTRFVIQAKPDSTSAAVIRGKVKLEAAGGELVLGAGEGGVAAKGERPVRHPIPRLSHLVSWAKGARARKEGFDASPMRKGNLIARFPGRDGLDYPLPVRDFKIDVHLENQVARVAIDQTFFNEHPSQLEGMYSFSLPAGAAISRLAMYVGGELMEAGIAERARARQVYESVVYRRRDPALMEWMAGNEVKVRIFPLFGRQEKRILLSYTESIERLYDDVQLTVPLPRLESPVGRLRLQARLAGCSECDVVSTSHAIETRVDGDDLMVSFDQKRAKIVDDLLLTIRMAPRPSWALVKKTEKGAMVHARVTPDLKATQSATDRPRRWVILHDTSASRQPLERQAQVHIIDRLLDELDETDEVSLIAFDATVRKFDGGEFVSVSNADRKAVHDFSSEQGKDGVGYTDLGKALDAASSTLNDAPDASRYEPMILYVGDGIVTGGERRLGELVKRVGGTTVVAVAVGATHDQSVLSALAGATGGLTAVLNPGQDLDWRVFDLVASLHSERITGLRAEIPGSDAPVYLSTKQIADGEELALTASVPDGTPVPKAIKLIGQKAGEPWSLDVSLPSGESDGAGYLPRLWARARIDALLSAEALDEATDHRAEVTALAMKNWLLTPYTSLLVLENDAAYKTYKVARSTMTGWAAYQVPEKIDVVREPLTAGVDLGAAGLGALVYRSPTPLFKAQQSFGYRHRGRGWGDVAGFDQFNSIGIRGSLSGEGIGGGGLGLSGTGRGFGFFGGAAGGKSAWLSTKAEKRKDSSRRAGSTANPAESVPALDANFSSNEELVTGGRFYRSFGEREQNQSVLGRTTVSRGPVSMPGRSFHAALQQPTGQQPTGLTHAYDQRFDDLTALLPGMFSSELDRVRERLVRESKSEDADGFELEPAAAAMIERARELAGKRRYSFPGGSLRIDSSGRFQSERKTITGLLENLFYDGSAFTVVYSELDVSIRREIGPTEPLLLEAEAPMLLAKPANLARFYDVKRDGDGRVSLSVPKASWKLVIDFDSEGRFASLTHVEGAVSTETLRLEWKADSVEIAAGAGSTKLGIESIADASFAADVPVASASIALPLRHPGLLEAQLENAPDRGKQRQLAATYAALGLFSKLAALAVKMADAAPLSTGELVLVSGGFRFMNAKNLARALKGEPSLMASYVRAGNRYRLRGNASEFDDVSKDSGWLGSLALLRQVEHASSTSFASGHKLFSKLLSRSDYQTFAFLGAFSLSNNHMWRNRKGVAKTWRELIAGDGLWALNARVRLATALSSAGRYEEAAQEWELIRDAALERGEVPYLDYQTQYAFTGGPRGQGGWRRFLNILRDGVLKTGETRQILALLGMTPTLGMGGDVPVLVKAAIASGIDNRERIVLIELVTRAGYPDLARQLFEPLREAVEADKVSSPDVLKLASSLATQRGESALAARLYKRAMNRGADSVSLNQLRGDYARLINLYSLATRSASDSETAVATQGLLDSAAEWRALDPDNSNIDSMVANVLFSIGEDQEASRVLSTSIERRPMEGRSFEVVAKALEAQGRVTEAVGLWRRAMSVEPENPTWALSLAKSLTADGRASEAKVVLDELLARKDWHERFVWIVSQAKTTRNQL